MKTAALVLTLVFATRFAQAQAVEYPLAPDLKLVAVEEACSAAPAACSMQGEVALGFLPGHQPHSYLKSLTVHYRGKAIRLETAGMFDPMLRPRQFGGFCYEGNTNCTFRGVFSDAGASYVAEWRIEGKAWRSVLSDSGDLVPFFLKNLNEPRYK